MIFNIFTLFPEFFESPLKTGLMGKAAESGIIKTGLIDIRDFSDNKHKRCDDSPYGGGSGMVLMPEPVFRAIEAQKKNNVPLILTSPGGRVLDQAFVKELAGKGEISIVCGNYEGVDQRIIDRYIDYEVSIGDYVISGGEFAALIIMNAVSRYVPGFMSNTASLEEESFEENLLEYPHYTRPQEINGMAVPEILLSGHHEKIRLWREAQSIEKTKRVRPDLYNKYLKK
ncbi:MAG: tRNA (guanosine(37)-N1)-methyltransferase TrmD [Spirochaetia bacterium]|nr:tRNA (guanosine(37)-N1)-methyltransferase TrmD [Spirochaetia bacterium]